MKYEKSLEKLDGAQRKRAEVAVDRLSKAIAFALLPFVETNRLTAVEAKTIFNEICRGLAKN